MNLMIERAFMIALLLSVSGFVFCAIFLPFERLAYRWTPQGRCDNQHNRIAFVCDTAVFCGFYQGWQ